jgi:hypothetical protein
MKTGIAPRCCSFCGVESPDSAEFKSYCIPPTLSDGCFDDGIWTACFVCDELIGEGNITKLFRRCASAHLARGARIEQAADLAEVQMFIFWKGWHNILN